MSFGSDKISQSQYCRANQVHHGTTNLGMTGCDFIIPQKVRGFNRPVVRCMCLRIIMQLYIIGCSRICHVWDRHGKMRQFCLLLWRSYQIFVCILGNFVQDGRVLLLRQRQKWGFNVNCSIYIKIYRNTYGIVVNFSEVLLKRVRGKALIVHQLC
jgi:hypothetical protein